MGLWSVTSSGDWSRGQLQNSALKQLRTRAGCECEAHVLQTLTDLDPNATILSIDGVGAVTELLANGRRRPHLALCPSLLWRSFRVLVGG